MYVADPDFSILGVFNCSVLFYHVWFILSVLLTEQNHQFNQSRA